MLKFGVKFLYHGSLFQYDPDESISLLGPTYLKRCFRYQFDALLNNLRVAGKCSNMTVWHITGLNSVMYFVIGYSSKKW